MPGMFFWNNFVSADAGPDELGLYMLASSQSIYACDPVVWTSVTGSQNRVRLLIQDDIDDLYVNGSTAGVLGFMPEGVATDANGNITTLASPVALTGLQPIYAVPSVAYMEPRDPVSGRAQATIYSCLNQIGGYLWENTTVTQSLIGTAVGLVISTLSGQAPTFFWSSGATTKIGRIVAVNVQDPLFNTAVTANVANTTHNPRASLGVLIYPTYNQFITNVAYDD